MVDMTSVEVRRKRWQHYLQDLPPKAVKDSRQARKLVRQGIPEDMRPQVWQFLAEVDQLRRPNVYATLTQKERMPIYDVIERDVPRCYPHDPMFSDNQGSGQHQLDQVLKAYAQYNPEVGYCQGMGFLVGVYLKQGQNAEEAFWLLATTIERYLPGYYGSTLYQVRVNAAVFGELLARHNEPLARHLSQNGVTPLTYATEWFISLYTTTLPWESVLRVWDWFYIKGPKILFRIGLAILDCLAPTLLTQCPTLGEILPCLLHIPPDELPPNVLMAAAGKVNITNHRIHQLTQRVIAQGVPDRGELPSLNQMSRRPRGLRPLQRIFAM